MRLAERGSTHVAPPHRVGDRSLMAGSKRKPSSTKLSEKRATQVVEEKRENVFLFVPNLIGLYA